MRTFALLVLTVLLSGCRTKPPEQISIQYFVDTNRTYTIQTLPSDVWQKSATTHLNFNFDYKPRYWVRTHISPTERSVLELAYPSLNNVTFYITDANGKTKTIKTGEEVDRAYWELDYRHPSVVLEPGSYSVVILVESTGTLDIDVKLRVLQTFSEDEMVTYILLGLFYGAAISLILYNFSLGIFMRESAHIYYSISCFGMTLFAANINGIAFQYLWPHANLWWIERTAWIGLSSCVFFGMQFLNKFLDASFVVYEKILVGIVLIFATACFLSGLLLPHHITARLVSVMMLTYSIATIIICAIRWNKGDSKVAFVVTASSILLVFMISQFFARFGWLPFNFLVINGFQIGLLVEAILYSIALADKQRRLSQQLIRAKEMSEGLLKESFKDLESALQSITDIHTARESDMTLAQSIQNVFKQQFPIVSSDNYIFDGFSMSADFVNGDFSFVRQNSEKAIIVIGDVAGHGVPASMIMMSVATSISAALDRRGETLTIEEIFDFANTRLMSLVTTENYVTSVFVEVHKKDNEIRVINAGHRSLMMVLDDRSATAPPNELPMGSVTSRVSEVQEFRFKKSFKACLFTDGLVENDYISEDDLKHALESIQTPQNLLTASSSFHSLVSNAKLEDDVTLIFFGRMQ